MGVSTGEAVPRGSRGKSEDDAEDASSSDEGKGKSYTESAEDAESTEKED
jgi:hypothetical protein